MPKPKVSTMVVIPEKIESKKKKLAELENCPLSPIDTLNKKIELKVPPKRRFSKVNQSVHVKGDIGLKAKIDEIKEFENTRNPSD